MKGQQYHDDKETSAPNATAIPKSLLTQANVTLKQLRAAISEQKSVFHQTKVIILEEKNHFAEYQKKHQNLVAEIKQISDETFDCPISFSSSNPPSMLSQDFPIDMQNDPLFAFDIKLTDANFNEAYLAKVDETIRQMEQALIEAKKVNECLTDYQKAQKNDLIKLAELNKSLEQEKKRIEIFNKHQALLTHIDNETRFTLMDLDKLSQPDFRFKDSKKQGLPIGKSSNDNLLSIAINQESSTLFRIALSKNYPFDIPEMGAENPFSQLLAKKPLMYDFLDHLAKKLTDRQFNQIFAVLNDALKEKEVALETFNAASWYIKTKNQHLTPIECQAFRLFLQRNHQNPWLIPFLTTFIASIDSIYALDEKLRQGLLQNLVQRNTDNNQKVNFSQLAEDVISLYEKPKLNHNQLIVDLKKVLNEGDVDAFFMQMMRHEKISSLEGVEEIDLPLLDFAFRLNENKKAPSNQLLNQLLQKNAKSMEDLTKNHDELAPARVIQIIELKPNFYPFDFMKDAFYQNFKQGQKLSFEEPFKAMPKRQNDYDKVMLAFYYAAIEHALTHQFDKGGIDAVINFGLSLAQDKKHMGLSETAYQVLLKRIKNNINQVLNEEKDNLENSGYPKNHRQRQKAYDAKKCASLMRIHRIQPSFCGIQLPGTLFFTPSTVINKAIVNNKTVKAKLDEEVKKENDAFNQLIKTFN